MTDSVIRKSGIAQPPLDQMMMQELLRDAVMMTIHNAWWFCLDSPTHKVWFRGLLDLCSPSLLRPSAAVCNVPDKLWKAQGHPSR